MLFCDGGIYLTAGQIPLWRDKGLLNFILTSADNAIPLCPTCHAQFDRADDPGFIFIPVDLKYFIDYELRDRKSRSINQTKGPTPRTVPTNVEYAAHCASVGLQPPGSTHGVYKRIWLKEFLLNGQLSLEAHGLLEPKAWHGAPLASIRRGIAALGSGRIDRMDDNVINDLQQLRDLYFRNLPANPDTSNLEPDSRKRKRDDADGGDRDRPMGRDDAPRKENNVNSNSTMIGSETWALGPTFTTQLACEQYASILTYT
jgi:hypothetical protein